MSADSRSRAGGSGDVVVRIACDESGYEGEKLIGSTTDVFAHASVRLDAERAAECMAELRRRIRSPAVEYKATHVLRGKHRSVLAWLLGPLGPLHRDAHVYLVDKAFFVVARLVAVFGMTSDAAVTLYRDGRDAFGGERWDTFLVSANAVMRTKQDGTPPVESFVRTVGTLRQGSTRGRKPRAGHVIEILDVLERGRRHAESFRTGLRGERAPLPPMDPLIPAVVRAVRYWGRDGAAVSIVHDRQNTLSQPRIAHLVRLLGRAPADTADPLVGRLVDLSLADSRWDARVQVADVLAGAARKIASDELNGRGDDELTALLRPYVDTRSVWADERSWSSLGPPRPAPFDD